MPKEPYIIYKAGIGFFLVPACSCLLLGMLQLGVWFDHVVAVMLGPLVVLTIVLDIGKWWYVVSVVCWIFVPLSSCKNRYSLLIIASWLIIGAILLKLMTRIIYAT
jgi:hypothetical protein